MNKEQLKEELEHRGLSTAGNKAELLIRLRGAIMQDGQDPENHEFDVKDQTMVVQWQLMAVIQRINQTIVTQSIRQEQNSAKIELALDDQKDAMKQSKEEMKQEVTQQIAEQNAEVKQELAKQNTRQEEITVELKQIQQRVDEKIQQLQQQISKFLKKIITKVFLGSGMREESVCI